jgi:hypothetical protein
VKLFAYGQCGIRSNHNIATKHGINRQCKWYWWNYHSILVGLRLVWSCWYYHFANFCKYRYRPSTGDLALMVTDNDGLTASDLVQITMRHCPACKYSACSGSRIGSNTTSRNKFNLVNGSSSNDRWWRNRQLCLDTTIRAKQWY